MVHFWVFLGIDRNSKHEKTGAPLTETPAHACHFVQSYSSWSCSPAELHYASDCETKIHIFSQMSIKNVKKVSLQFELLNTYYSNSACKMSYTPNYCPSPAHGVCNKRTSILIVFCLFQPLAEVKTIITNNYQQLFQ